MKRNITIVVAGVIAVLLFAGIVTGASDYDEIPTKITSDDSSYNILGPTAVELSDCVDSQEVKFKGNVIDIIYYISGTYYKIQIDEIISDITGNMSMGDTVSVGHHFDSPADVDSVSIGDSVVVFGEYTSYFEGVHGVSLASSEHSLKLAESSQEVLFNGILTDVDSSCLSYDIYTIQIDYIISDPTGSIVTGDAANVWCWFDSVAYVDHFQIGDKVEVHGTYGGYKSGMHRVYLESSEHGLKNLEDFLLFWKNETSDYVHSVSVSENGEYVAIGSKDTYVYYFNKFGDLIWKHKTNGAVNSVSTSNDGNYVIAGSDDHNIYYFDKNGLLWEIEVDVSITAVDISSDGRYAIAGSWNKYVYFLDSHNPNKLLWKRLLDVYVVGVGISDNGGYVAIGGREYVYLLDKYNTTIWEKDTGGVVDISGDGNYIIVGGGLNDRTTYCYDRSGELKWDDPYDEYLDDKHSGFLVSISSVSLSTDGNYSAVGSWGWDITIRSFDKTGNVVWRIKNDTYAVDISGDGHYIAAGASSSEIGERILYIDNFDNGNIIYDYNFEDPVWEIDLSNDGKYFAAAAKNTVYFFGPANEDSDGDSIPNNEDNCPFKFNPIQEDRDLDYVGDACDNCPTIYSRSKDGCPTGIDSDNDGVFDVNDACLEVPGVACNRGCPTVDDDGDGLQESTSNCPDYDHSPNDRDNDGDPDSYDCAPDDPNRHHEAAEDPGNGLDDDCDDIIDEPTCTDNDGDGYGDGCSLGNDCDDDDPSINPAATETCGDEIDQDCSGDDLSCPTEDLTATIELENAVLVKSVTDLESAFINDDIAETKYGEADPRVYNDFGSFRNPYYKQRERTSILYVPEGKEITVNVRLNSIPSGPHKIILIPPEAYYWKFIGDPVVIQQNGDEIWSFRLKALQWKLIPFGEMGNIGPLLGGGILGSHGKGSFHVLDYDEKLQPALYLFPELLKFYVIYIDSETGDTKRGKEIEPSMWFCKLPDEFWNPYGGCFPLCKVPDLSSCASEDEPGRGVRITNLDQHDFESKKVIVYNTGFSLPKGTIFTKEYVGTVALESMGYSRLLYGIGSASTSFLFIYTGELVGLYEFGNLLLKSLYDPSDRSKVAAQISGYSKEFITFYNGIGKGNSPVCIESTIKENTWSNDIVTGSLTNLHSSEIRVSPRLIYIELEDDVKGQPFVTLKPGEATNFNFEMPNTGINILDHRNREDYRVDFVTYINDKKVIWPLPLSSKRVYSGKVHSPVNLHAIDQYGRHIGVNSTGGVDIEIPGAYYSGPDSHPQEIRIYDPSLDVRFYTEGTEAGNFTLEIEKNNDSQAEIVQYNNVNVINQSIAIVNAYSTGINPTMYFDSEGDGFMEMNIPPTSFQSHETIPPFLDNISYPSQIDLGESVDIEVTIGDNSTVENASVYMFYPSGYAEEMPMNYVSRSIESGYNLTRFAYIFTNTSELGSYEFYILSEDIHDNSRGFGAYRFATSLGAIRLHPDWNLISIPLVPEDTNTASVLSPISGNYSIIWEYNASDTTDHWKKYDPSAPFGNDLTDMGPRKGYWILMNSDDTLPITGTVSESTDIGLKTSWNLIGYNSLDSQPIADALSSISGNYDIVWEYDASDTTDHWKKYDPNAPFGNDLTDMKPGKGYWILMNSDGTLEI